MVKQIFLRFLIDRILLTRFYYCMYKDIEETKKLIEINYAMRQNAPNIFINRDPTDEDTKNSAAYADMVPIPGLTPENYRVSILHINNPDPLMVSVCIRSVHFLNGQTDNFR